MTAAFILALELFATAWKSDFLKEITGHQYKSTTEQFLSDNRTTFKFTPRNATREFVSKSKHRYTMRRRWVNKTHLLPMWPMLTSNFDTSRTRDIQEKCVDSYIGFSVRCDPECDEVDENVRNAILYMIAVINPDMAVPDKCQQRKAISRIPTHRRNGKLYESGRLL